MLMRDEFADRKCLVHTSSLSDVKFLDSLFSVEYRRDHIPYRIETTGHSHTLTFLNAPRSYHGRMGWTSPEAKTIFRWFVRSEQERRRIDRETVIEALQNVPVSDTTAERLSGLSPEDAETALKRHPGYALHRKIESVRSMLELYRRAISDVTAAIEDFPELGRPDERAMRERLEHEVSIRVAFADEPV